MMNFNDKEEIKNAGFRGFVKVEQLRNDYSCIPSTPGVYLVLNPKRKKDFLTVGTGGYFHGKEPNVAMSELENNWVDDTIVVYIGKTKDTLQKRIKTYMQFGQREDVAHYGGRFIWQLRHSAELEVCWMPLNGEDSREVEKRLIHEFKKEYGKRPFANLID